MCARVCVCVCGCVRFRQWLRSIDDDNDEHAGWSPIYARCLCLDAGGEEGEGANGELSCDLLASATS